MTSAESRRAVGRRRASGPTALVALLVVAYLVAFQWAATRVFLLNFSTAGPNATAVLLVLYVTGWAVGVAGLLSVGRRALFVGGSLLVGVATVLAPFPGPLSGGLLSVAAMTVATPMLVVLAAEARESVAVGAGIGLLAHHAVRIWRDTAALYATSASTALALALGGGLVATALWLARTGALPPVEWSAPSVSATPLFAFLFFEGLFLAFPHVVARWWLRPYVPTALAAVVGLVAALAWLLVPDEAGWLPDTGRLSARSLWVVALAFLLSVLALLFWSSAWSVLALAPAQAGALVLLAAGCRERSPRRLRALVGGLVGVQFVGVVLVFLSVSAANWAFMPGPLDTLTRDRQSLFVVLVGALLPLTAVLATRSGTVGADPGSDSPAVDPGRRSLLAGAGIGALAGLGLFAPPLRSGVDRPDSPPYRVLTYNVHQYFGGDGDGRYNLEAVADLVRDSGAHVVGLQESEGGRVTSGNVDGVRWLAERLDYHCVYGAPTSTASYGVAVLSAWPVVEYDVVQLPVRRSTARLAVVAVLDAPDGPLPVVVTHFQIDKPAARQTAEARRVVELATAERDFDRAVVMGDFNVRASENREPLQILRSAFTDAWTAADRRSGPPATFVDPPQRIDYVFLHGDWEVQSAATLGTLSVSDHRGVLAVVDPG